ncbi:hypothetical protein SANT12839_027190 [Streptomyces antimycoticus]|uniref:Uncharacterized protein n=1 Tax=Streptomyces antimycoticus TaxID=68175 RepID=A0A4D4K654_9ACTN|nr:hypothetical protein SANT12839_027190 [Streptomyces antimycoticus]
MGARGRWGRWREFVQHVRHPYVDRLHQEAQPVRRRVEEYVAQPVRRHRKRFLQRRPALRRDAQRSRRQRARRGRYRGRRGGVGVGGRDPKRSQVCGGDLVGGPPEHLARRVFGDPGAVLPPTQGQQPSEQKLLPYGLREPVCDHRVTPWRRTGPSPTGLGLPCAHSLPYRSRECRISEAVRGRPL